MKLDREREVGVVLSVHRSGYMSEWMSQILPMSGLLKALILVQ